MAVLVDVWFQPQYHVTIDHDKVEALARTTTWAFYHAAGGSGVGVSREVDDGDDVNALVEETKAELQMLFGVEDTAYDVRFCLQCSTYYNPVAIYVLPLGKDGELELTCS